MINKEIISNIYAKYDSKLGYHPLICHMIDSSCVAYYIWKDIIGKNSKNNILKYLNIPDEEALKFIPFLVGLHDIGKASEPFQVKLKNDKSLEKYGFKKSKIYIDDVYHTLYGYYILKNHKFPNTNENFSEIFCSIISGHHGVFSEYYDIINSESNIRLYEENFYHWVDIRNFIINDIFDLWKPNYVKINNKENIFVLLLESIISISDWISSNPYFFNYEKDFNIVNIKSYYDKSLKIAENIFNNNINWKNYYNFESKDFKDLFDFVPCPTQSKVEHICKNDNPKLIIIEVPTGEGKTEAALLAQNYFRKKYNQKGLYFALPTMATSNQMFNRVEKYIKKSYSNEKINYHLIHSHSLLSDNYHKIKTSGINNNENLIADEWFSVSKRVLLAPFAVGTVDQSLLSVLKVKYGYLRLFGLSDKTIIFDEIHAYDIHMSLLFEELLEWLGKIGSTVIILSATLSKERLLKLASKYAGKEFNLNSIGKYPRISWVNDSNDFYSETVSVNQDHEIKLIKKDNEEDIINDILDLTNEGGNIAWICNTVDNSRKLYQKIKEDNRFNDYDIELFHSRFLFGDRLNKEKNILKKYSKDALKDRNENNNSLNKKSILISTQIIEQSLDLDFDLMVSEIAPIDLIIQRVGRLHRHKIKRNNKLKNSILYVNMNFKHNIFKIYNEYIMLKTNNLLKNVDKIKIPENVENFIEYVYSKNNEYEKEYKELFKEKEIKKLKIKNITISGPLKKDIIKESFDILEEENPDVGNSLKATTRNESLPTVSAICLNQIGDELYVIYHEDEKEIREKIENINDLSNDDKKILLNAETRFSFHGCDEIISEDLIPDEWKKISLLKFHRKLIFKNKCCEIKGIKENIYLYLDDDLGVIMEGKNDEIFQSDS